MNFSKAEFVPKRIIDIEEMNFYARKDPAHIVTETERRYSDALALLAKNITERGCRVVMLSGPSSSGKTTSSYRLASVIKSVYGRLAHVVSLDNFFKPVSEYPKDENGQPDYESVHALDIERVNTELERLVSEGVADIPEFDFNRERPVRGSVRLEIGDGVAVVEGIHALNPLLTASVENDGYVKVYAGLRREYGEKGERTISSREVRLIRRLVRDYRDRGHSPDRTLSMWQGVCRGEDRFIRCFKSEADYLLDTALDYELGVTAGEFLKLREMFSPQYDDVTLPLCERLEKLVQIDGGLVPEDSILREFTGGLVL